MAETALAPLDRCDPRHRRALEAILALRAEDLPFVEGKVPATQAHLRVLTYNFDGLGTHFRGRPVQVSADLPLWYVRFGRDRRPRRRHVSPDVLVTLDVEPRHDLDKQVVWEVGKAPDFVLEALSPSTWRRDVTAKKRIYELIGVREYFVFDATGGRPPPLRGFALSGGAYQPMREARMPNGGTGLASRVLGLWAHCRPRAPDSPGGAESLEFRWFDPGTGRDIPTREEFEERVAEFEERVAEEAAARQAEAAGRRRAEAAARRAEATARRAEAVARRAEAAARQEEAAARAAEKRILELEALLASRPR